MIFLNTVIFTIGSIQITPLISLQVILSTLTGYFLGRILIGVLRKRLAAFWEFFGKSTFLVESVLRLFLLAGGLSLGLRLAGIKQSVIYYFYLLLFKPFFHIGSSPVSIISISLLLIIVSVSVFVARYTSLLLRKDVYPNTNIDPGVQNILDNFVKYLVIATGVIIGLQVNGINLSVFATIGAGLMVGVGFGLQNIASNFISGVVILLERPIKVGDYVEVDKICGTVDRIQARSTLIKTRENILMVVPNSKFISENVINWSLNDDNVLIEIPVGISYKSNPEAARDVLLAIAEDHEKILSKPPPVVLLEKFDNSSINMTLEVWITDVQRRFEIISDVNFLIYRRFNESGVVIPFPQLDVHMKN